MVINAALMASILRAEFGDTSLDRRILFGVYDLVSRRVHVPVSAETEPEPVIRLLDAPAGPDELRELARQVISSGFIQRLLGR